MQTQLADFIKNTPQGQEADAILRKCVHCGFCNATCPTYRLLGDELDGPRGRIYLIKQMLEGNEVSVKTQHHLDRCLTCLNCQTTCPSGVEYEKLLGIGRILIEQRVTRPLSERITHRALRWLLPHRARFERLLRLGQLIRPLLPNQIKGKIPRRDNTALTKPQHQHTRKVILLDGCVQPALSPATNIATAKVLDALSISVIHTQQAGCCGAVSYHLGASQEALGFMKHNIDVWWPHIEAGAEAIITTASGCGIMVKHYDDYLGDTPGYADKAKKIAALTQDIAEFISKEDQQGLHHPKSQQIVFHPPCTLQHGQRLSGVVEQILTRAGLELLPVKDSHLCCGSAGTYSILQPDLSQQLLHDKLHNLQQTKPTLIATANIGCQVHLQSKADVPVIHWIELLARAIP